jgi:hypothetical protein
MSLKDTRHTVSLLLSCMPQPAVFCLSVPVVGMEPLLLACGGSSGADVPDKIAALRVPLCAPGDWSSGGAPAADGAPPGGLEPADTLPAGAAAGAATGAPTADDEQEEACARQLAVRGCAAHMVARVMTQAPLGDGAHTLFTCMLLRGWVRPGYWQSGKLFSPPPSPPPPAAGVDDGRDKPSPDSLSSALPPYLMFFGSATFGAATPLPANPPAGAAPRRPRLRPVRPSGLDG